MVRVVHLISRGHKVISKIVVLSETPIVGPDISVYYINGRGSYKLRGSVGRWYVQHSYFKVVTTIIVMVVIGVLSPPRVWELRDLDRARKLEYAAKKKKRCSRLECGDNDGDVD